MNKFEITFCIISVFLSISVFRQNCNQGNQKPINSITPKIEEWPIDSLDVLVQDPSDPNEIIGTRGCDALGDILQWMAETDFLPYTIYFEKYPKLASFIIENDLGII